MEVVDLSNPVDEVSALIRAWEEEHSATEYDPIRTLTRIAELTEIETENYLKMDPDPFDERHPSRTDPDCKFGQILKTVFRKDNFMSKLLNDYMKDTYYSRNNITDRNIDDLNIAAARLLLDLMPGLETTVVFQDMEVLIHRLIKWTTKSKEPLQSYATGILASAMDIPEVAAKFREENARLVPLLLARLKRLKDSSDFVQNINVTERPFGHLSSINNHSYSSDSTISINGVSSPANGPPITVDSPAEREPSEKKRKSFEHDFTSPQSSDNESNRRKRARLDMEPSIQLASLSPRKSNPIVSETSNSSWADLETFMISNVQMFPPNIVMRQILILRYLTPIGEYQEFLSHAFHDNIAFDLLLIYVNVRATKQARLAFEALKYLAALLCHKKFSIEFLQRHGLEALLEVPRPSIAATGVSICLYYLGYCEDAMESVCLLPRHTITKLVKYALWLLECSHDSGKCQAIMFFGLTFQFKIILDEFDAQDGLRKLHNVMSTLPILQPERENEQINDDMECAARQIVRHVCVAYRRYLEAHLYHKAEAIKRTRINTNDTSVVLVGGGLPAYKACKSSPKNVQDNIELLLQYLPLRAHWNPVEQLIKLGDIMLLLKIIAFAYEWNYNGRAETVRCALETLAIACIMPKVLQILCEKVDLPEEKLTVGFSIIIGAAEGEIVRDSEVEKAALRVIANCVCAPINRIDNSSSKQGSTSSPSKRLKFKTSEELIQKVWDCVRANSGILVLIQLINCKTPITDADAIRTLACKGLAGLARCETVKQIVSKLPLFTSGELQSLMRGPILQEKRQEHVEFQKYAMELLERLSGLNLDVSLANINKIHKANVVAQTKIQFNARQLLQLIHQHLVSKGLTETAAILVKEANLSNSIMSLSAQHPSKFRYSTDLTPCRTRLSFSNASQARLSIASNVPESSGLSSTAIGSGSNTPIKLIKKTPSATSFLTPTQNSRLQKLTDCEPYFRAKTTYIPDDTPDQARVTLDTVVTEYLASQHALCENPMAACPQFNLFVPHKCPDPKPKLITLSNVATRFTRAQIGYQSKTMDRRFVHSRFCPVQTIRSSTEEGFFTCAKFCPRRNSVIVGDYNGTIHIFNKNTGNEEHSFSAHESYIMNIEPSRNGRFLLSSSTWGEPTSVLWSLEDINIVKPFNHQDFIEFSKVSQDKIIGTKAEKATIYDVATGKSVQTFVPQLSNLYTRNKATFSMDDELVLTDGVLFDVKSGKEINRLDKLNQTQNGVFHPNGLEIISNTEVWDIRTDLKKLRLLKTVPILNECSVTFSPVNSVLYGIALEQELDDGDSTYDTSFKTVDSNDYTSIATIEVKKNIVDLAVNCYDTQIAIVENQGLYNSIQESVVRLYDVGRQRDDDDEQEEEDDEVDESDDGLSEGGEHVVIDLTGDNNDDNAEGSNNDADSFSDDSMSTSSSLSLNSWLLDDNGDSASDSDSDNEGQ